MKKYFKTMFQMTKGARLGYLFCFIVLFLAVGLSVLSTFMLKVLVDTLTKDIINSPEKVGQLELFVASLFGGPEFLSNNLWIFSIIIIGIALAVALISCARLILRTYASTSIGKNIQLTLFEHIDRFPYSYFKRHDSGNLIQICTRDETELRKFMVADTFSIVYTFYIVCFSVAILLSLSWKIALVPLILLPVLFIYSFFLIKSVRSRYKATDESDAIITGRMQENLNAVRIVKAYNNESYEIGEFDKNLDDYKHKFIRWRGLSSFFFSSSDIFVFGTIVLTLIFGLYLALTGEISAGTVVVSFSYVEMMVWPLRDVATILSNLAKALVSIDRINLIIKEPIEDIVTGVKPPINGEIIFDNVSFKFDDSNTSFIKNVSFKIKAGQTVAIMGKTGSGKSTIAYLLTRLYDYTSGSIRIDGIELSTIAKEYLRKNVSTVLQEPFLFSKSIMNNIRVAHKEATEEQVYKAADIADIHESISSFQSGYNTEVGEKGVTLSGGQKQRVAIARTILDNSPILIFDDSLSAVDTETDYRIRQRLKDRQKNTTTLIITHRVATAKDADLIIVLEDGQVSEMGSHDELVIKPGLYKRIYEIQTRMT
ncbi:MAG: ABC transporter ATP-binding protein [Bacilli bacterium]